MGELNSLANVRQLEQANPPSQTDINAAINVLMSNVQNGLSQIAMSKEAKLGQIVTDGGTMYGKFEIKSPR